MQQQSPNKSLSTGQMTPVLRRLIPFTATLMLLVGAHAVCQQSMPSPSHRVTHRNHPDSNKPESKSTPQLPPSPSAPASSEIRQPQTGTVRWNPEPKAYDWRDAFAPPTWSNWALVAVGIIASIVGIRSLRAVIRQSEATEKSADAAKVSSTALINIERPWLLVSDARREQDSSQKTTSCHFKVTNYGKIPATILEVGGTFTGIGDMRELPTKPQYGVARFFNSRPLAVDMQSSEIWIPFEENKFISAETRKGIWIAFGFVKYTGASFNDGPEQVEPYETSFCYCFSPHVLPHPCGPPGYNKHT
jgi:hypothetical protein